MSVQNERQNSAPMQDKKPHSEEEFIQDAPAFGFPNSALLSMPEPPPPGTPNSVMREMMSTQETDAEETAGQFSEGFTRIVPNSIQREINADSGRISGNPFTSFLSHDRRTAGPTPSVFSHELIHTINQSAFPARAGQSAAFNTIQREPGKKPEEGSSAEASPASTPASGTSPDVTPAALPAEIPPVSTPATRTVEEMPLAADGTRSRSGSFSGTRPRLNSLSSSRVTIPNPALSSAGSTAEEAAEGEHSPDLAPLRTDLDRLEQSVLEIQGLQQQAGLMQLLQSLPQRISGLRGQLENEEEQDQRTTLGRQIQSLVDLQQRYEAIDLSDIRARITRLRGVQDPQQLRDALDQMQQQIQDIRTIIDQLQQLPADFPAAPPAAEDDHESADEHGGDDDGDDDGAGGGGAGGGDGADDDDGDGGGGGAPNTLLIAVAPNPSHFPVPAITDQEVKQTFNIETDAAGNEKKKFVWRMFSKNHIDTDKMAAIYKYMYSENFYDRAGREKNMSDVGGEIDYALGQVKQLGAAPAPPAPPGAAVPGAAALTRPEKTHTDRAKDAAFVLGESRNTLAFLNSGHQTGELAKVWKELADKAEEAKKAIEIGTMMPPKDGEKDPRVVDKADIKLRDNFYAKWVNTIGGGMIDLAGTAAGLINVVLMFQKFVKDVQNVNIGASRADAVISGLDTIGAAASTLSSAWSMVKNFGGTGATVATQSAWASAIHATEAIPWLSVISGGINMVTGAIEGIRGWSHMSRINGALQQLQNSPARAQAAQQRALQVDPQNGQRQKSDQDKLNEIFKQGREVAEIHTVSGGLKFLAGGLAAAGGAATLTGAGAPIGAGLAAAAAIVTAFKMGIERYGKSRLRKNVVADEYGIDWSKEMKQVKAMIKHYNKHMAIRDQYNREVILKAHNAEGLTRTAAFKAINVRRANYLFAHVENNTPYADLAEKVIEAMGVHKIKDKVTGQSSFSAGAKALLAEKLGGA